MFFAPYSVKPCKMNDLLALALSAHGGSEKWNGFSSLKAHLHFDGVVWGVKGRPGVFKDVHYHANIHKQEAGFTDYPLAGQDTTFTPDLITIEAADGKILEQLASPRDSFAGNVWDTPWSVLQMLYFSNYAFWTYFTAPFNFVLPGYLTEEISPWTEGADTWRRLQVTFPDTIATHNRIQVFFYDKNGLLRRHDYAPDILGSFPSTQIVSEYREYSGIMLPSKRKIYIRSKDDSFQTEPVLVDVDVESIAFN
jgi:hypothetical protein